jgi:hypothetical protein
MDDRGANAKRFGTLTKPLPVASKELITRLDLVITSITKMETKKEKIYPKGMMTFAPRGNAPDFVLGALVITPNDLYEWLKTQEEHSSEYNGKKQFRFQILEGKEGPYLVLDTFKPNTEAKQDNVQDDSLPF